MGEINEKNLENYSNPIFIEGVENILEQMKKKICKVILKDGNKGTGFFCNMPFPDKDHLLPSFITNNHLINEKYLKEEKEIMVKLNNDKVIKIIKLEDKIKYTNKDYDITLIEIKKEDEIDDFLEIDDNILNDPGLGYIGNSIYLIHYPSYPNGENVAVSFGVLKSIYENKKYNFIHYCCTENGSTGSPILNSSKNKVIGIHIQNGKDNQNYNIGTFLYNFIKEFNNNYNNKNERLDEIKNESDIKKYENEITLKYRNVYSQIKIFGCRFVEKNKDKCKIIYMGKEQELSPYLEIKDKIDIIEIKLKINECLHDMSYMFYGCTDLISIPDAWKLDIKEVKSMNEMFCGCISLKDLTDIHKWNINVDKINVAFIFFCCSSLESLSEDNEWYANLLKYQRKGLFRTKFSYEGNNIRNFKRRIEKQKSKFLK